MVFSKFRRTKPVFSEQDRINLRWFWDNYLKSKTPWLLVVLGTIVIQGVAYQQFLALTESGLRVIFESGSVWELVRVCATVFMLFAVRGLMSYLSPRLSVWLASEAVLQMRDDMIDHLMRLDLAFFERTKTGEIILRLVNQAQDLSMFVGQATVNAIRDAVTVLIVSGYLIYLSPQLFLAALLVIPVIILLLLQVSERIKVIQANAESALSNYMTGIDEMAGGMRTVKISNQEPSERSRLRKAAREIRSLTVRLQASEALVLPSIDLSSAFVYVLVIGGGGYMALNPAYEFDSAGVITFLLGLVLLFDPARMVAQFFTKLQANLILLEGVHSLFRETPTITDAPDAVTEFDTSGDIVLRDVVFRYSDTAPLFDGLNMTFEGGKTTAIVGSTGSGKTTILSLIARLYNVIDGQITIGGQPIESLKVDALRHSFSVVAQDIVIFNNSILENIRYVRPDASEGEIWEAAERAAIADLIRQRGDAPVGPKGAQLSGGQKQRIAIARAFLRSAPILMLDEATSALDQRTEHRIRGTLAELGKGKTTIVVTHRLSSVTYADWIYVMEGGQVVEQGTHKELVAANGLYASMYDAQRNDYGTAS
ncbi:ABC transporter ATP-binding protein [Roseovarius sp. A46]|uniref:ABC transporter ATP-binding protein n=1 Tax=Roseovarius sp. A46 TaxID=2109331 RepID=UPI001011584C|nr:ABC transporter ATP-binding protein [Roseovarius sp. A46]RXV59033.1 ABC transporter ATP-binding protein [Roseovarius sp. A46]